MSPLLILCNVLSVNVVWQGLAVDSQKLEVGTLILNWSDGWKILCGVYICVRSKINYVNFVSHYVLYLINHTKLTVN